MSAFCHSGRLIPALETCRTMRVTSSFKGVLARRSRGRDGVRRLRVSIRIETSGRRRSDPPGLLRAPARSSLGFALGAHSGLVLMLARSAVAQRKMPVAQRSMRSGARRRMDAAIGAPEGARAVFGPRAIRICAFRRAIPLGSRGGRKEQTPGASTHRGEEDVCLQALKVRPSSARRSGLREGGSGSAKEKSPSP